MGQGTDPSVWGVLPGAAFRPHRLPDPRMAERVGYPSLPPCAAPDRMEGMEQRDVLVVLFDGVQALDVTGPIEVFHGATQGVPGAYRIRTASLDGAPVRTTSGLTLVPDRTLAAAATPHTLLVPGGEGTREPDPRLVDWLRANAPHARRKVSVCSGALLLAEAGLLDGRRATTHWMLCPTLAERFPAVRVEPEPIYVRDGDLATSAGVTAGIDLALALVEEDLGRDLALAVARHLVVFLRRPGNQTQFSAQLAAQTAQRRCRCATSSSGSPRTPPPTSPSTPSRTAPASPRGTSPGRSATRSV